jgi:hypothetical protein
LVKPSSFTLSEGEGPKTVYAWVIDRAGNISSYKSASITLDMTPPTGSIVINGGDTYTKDNTVTLTLTYSDANGVLRVRYSNDNVHWEDWRSPEDSRVWVLSPGDGTKTVYYQVMDVAGNVSTFSDSIVLDMTSDPVVGLTSPTHPDNQKWYADNSPSFQWPIPTSTSPIVGYSYSLDQYGSTVPAENVNLTDNFISFTGLADGIWYFHVRAKDAAGNWGPASHFRVQIDVTPDAPPDVSSPTHPNPSLWYNSRTVQFNWTPPSSTSPIAGYLHDWDENENTVPASRLNADVTSLTRSATSDGTWYFHIRAVDAAGNLGSICHFKVNIDTEPPAAPTPRLPENGAVLDENTPTLRWEHPENLENYQIEIYDNEGRLVLAGSSSVNWFDTQPLPDGHYKWRVRGVDSAQNLGHWSENFFFTVDTTSPPAPILRTPKNNDNMHVGGPTFAWDRVDDLTPVTYELWVDNDVGFSSGIKLTGLVENSYTPPVTLSGTFYWKVRAWDAAGNKGEWSEVWAFANRSSPPVVTDILVEWSHNPNRVTTKNPVISWTFQDNDNDSQMGVRIQVALLPGSEDNSDLVWNFENDELTENSIVYIGGFLSKGTIYFVRVRVRDNLGVWGPWSDCQYHFTLNNAPRVENFRINGQTNPVYVSKVVFSWDYFDEDYDDQACYQIQVGSQPGRNDIWDSGEVKCGLLKREENLDSEIFGGLAENTKYYVRMRLKDGRMRGNEVGETFQWSDWAYGSFVTNVHPRITSAQLNGGRIYTTSREVLLTVDAVGGAPIENLIWKQENDADWVIEGFSPSKTLTLSGGDGLKEIWLKVRDREGWEAENVFKVSIILDTTPPTGLDGTYPADGATVGSSPVRLSWTVPSDEVSGVVSVFNVEVSSDESFTSPQVFTAEKNYYDLSLGDQKMTIYWRVRAKDRAGNETCSPIHRFTYDPTPPSLAPSPSLQLSTKTTIVNSLEVPIALGGSNVAAYRYAFSQEELAKVAWIPYTENVLKLRLPSEGQYLVYFEAKSPAGTTAGPFVISLFADLTAPQVQLSADNLASRSKVRTLYIFASDKGGSGVSEMRLKVGDNWGSWENFVGKRVLELNEGLNVVMVQVRDRAGNESAPAKLELYYSARPPEVEKVVAEDVSGREVETTLDNLPSVLAEPAYTLQIPAEPGVFLFVNGEKIEPTGGFWVVNLRLREGKNTFILSTVDLAGSMWEKTLEITYTPKAATAQPTPGKGFGYIPLFAGVGATGLGVLLASRLRGRPAKPPVQKRPLLRPVAVKPFARKEEGRGEKEEAG